MIKHDLPLKSDDSTRRRDAAGEFHHAYQMVFMGQDWSRFTSAVPPRALNSSMGLASKGEITFVAHAVSLAKTSRTERSIKTRRFSFRSFLSRGTQTSAF